MAQTPGLCDASSSTRLPPCPAPELLLPPLQELWMPARRGRRPGRRRAPIGVIPAAPPAPGGRPFPPGIKGHPRAEHWGHRRPRPPPSEALSRQFLERQGHPREQADASKLSSCALKLVRVVNLLLWSQCLGHLKERAARVLSLRGECNSTWETPAFSCSCPGRSRRRMRA